MVASLGSRAGRGQSSRAVRLVHGFGGARGGLTRIDSLPGRGHSLRAAGPPPVDGRVCARRSLAGGCSHARFRNRRGGTGVYGGAVQLPDGRLVVTSVSLGKLFVF